MLAHIFWYKDHVATVHSHNGKFHVHKELMEDVKKNNAEKNSTISKKETSANDHISVKELNVSTDRNFAFNCFYNFTPSLFQTCLSADFPPPKS